MSEQLFDQIVSRTRLSPVLAPFTVTRLLVRAGVDPKHVNPEQLGRALPEFEQGLAVYLPPEDVAQVLDDLRALAAA